MPRAQLSYIGQDLGVIGPRDSDKNWAPMSISSVNTPISLLHSQSHRCNSQKRRKQQHENAKSSNTIQKRRYKKQGFLDNEITLFLQILNSYGTIN